MLDCFVKDFKQSHGFKSKSGLIIGHIGSLFILFLVCGLFCYV